MSLKLQARTTYTDGRGRRVNIAGMTFTTVGGEPVYWSIGGDHYTESGRFVHSRRKPDTDSNSLIIEYYTTAESARNLVAEDTSEDARKWWIGVNV